MLNKNKLVLASVIGALFIASCSNEMAVESSSDSAGGGKAMLNLWHVQQDRISVLKMQ